MQYKYQNKSHLWLYFRQRQALCQKWLNIPGGIYKPKLET